MMSSSRSKRKLHKKLATAASAPILAHNLGSRRESVVDSSSYSTAQDLFDSNPFEDLSRDSLDDFMKNVVPNDAFLSRGRPSDGTLGLSDGLKRTFLLLSLGALILAGVFFLKPWSWFDHQTHINAYFEIRAIDQSGIPVPGAAVSNGSQKFGMTDSFGEWRRYLNVSLGSTIPLTITKVDSTGKVISSTRNFAIPNDPKFVGTFEVKSTVELLNQAATSKTAVSKNIDPKTQDVQKQTLMENSAPASLASASLTQTVSEEPKALINDPSNVGGYRDRSSVFVQVSSQPSNRRLDAVGHSISARLKELGFTLKSDADWTITLKPLNTNERKLGTEDSGVFLVESKVNGADNAVLSSFLRNYQSDPAATAKATLYILGSLVDKEILISKDASGRWLAGLPPTTPKLWTVSPQVSVLVNGQPKRMSQDMIKTADLVGAYFLDSLDSVCKDSQSCKGQLMTWEHVPPVSNWTRLEVVVNGSSYKAPRVFVSGYQARAKSGSTFEYWGQAGQQANITVLDQDRIVYRGKIKNQTVLSGTALNKLESRR